VYRAAWLYGRCLRAHLRSTLEYEADFWIMSVAAVVTQGIGVVFLWAIFRRIPVINGWPFWDVVLIYALVVIGEGISQLFSQGTWNLAQVVNTGGLDPVLIRPYSPVLQILSSEVGMNGLGNLALGTGLLAGALAHVHVHWTVWHLTWAVTVLISAALVKIGLNLGTNSAAFWLKTPYSMFPFSMHTLGELARFPLTIYSTAIQLVLSVLLPFAFMSFYPATSVLGHGAPAWIGLLTPLVAVYCLFLGVCVFRLGLRRYESSGH
jgi:ABC-2 type transport system permease protein